MFNKSNVFLLVLWRAMFWEKIQGNGRQKPSSECYCEKKNRQQFSIVCTLVHHGTGSARGGSGIQVYPKKFAKIPKNTQNSSKYTQNYTQVYFIPEIQRKWYTEYPYLSCHIPYTRFKKPLYTVYPKTMTDPDSNDVKTLQWNYSPAVFVVPLEFWTFWSHFYGW